MIVSARWNKIAADYLDRDPDAPCANADYYLRQSGSDFAECVNSRRTVAARRTDGRAMNAAILVSRQLSEVERSQAMHYRMGDVLRFNVGDGAPGYSERRLLDGEQVLPEQQWIQLDTWDNRISQRSDFLETPFMAS